MNLPDKIMIVDDSKTNLAFLENQLLPLDYKVIKATNGKEAIDVLEKNKDVILIILDIVMPVMNGYETCKYFKKNPETANIPIIFVTSLTEQDTKLKCIECGGDEFLTKPANKYELIARTRALISKKKVQDELEYSYKKITEIIDSTDYALSKFDPFTFDFDRSNNSLLLKILKNSGDSEGGKPEYVLFASKEGRYLMGNVYYKWNGKLVKIPERIVVDISSDISLSAAMEMSGRSISFEMTPEFDKAELMYSNWNDCPQSSMPMYQNQFNDKIRYYIGCIRNYVMYLTEHLVVVAFNYGKKVDEIDAQILKGFVIHSNFLKTISDQTKMNEAAFHYTVKALARASEANDEDTYSHILRVNEYANTLALQLECPDKFAKDIGIYAQMHDVGKIHVDRAILRKHGKLTKEEYDVMKEHTIYGAKILGDSLRLRMAHDIAISHHEKYNGRGYPYALKGDGIPMAGRIVSLVDVYDALRSKRYYKPAISHEESYKIITAGDGRTVPDDFDPKIIDAFKKSHNKFKEIFLKVQDESI